MTLALTPILAHVIISLAIAAHNIAIRVRRMSTYVPEEIR